MLTADQKLRRRAGIGSSDIAAILGEDPFKGPVEVWLDKSKGIESESSEQAAWGHFVEDALASWYVSRHGVELVRGDTMASPLDPRIMATPDRLVRGQRGAMECKSVGHRVLHHWRADRDTYRAPARVVIQVTWQMGVLREAGHDVDHVVIVALLGGRDFHEEIVTFDAALFSEMRAHALDWWDKYVTPGVMPPPDGSEAARRLLTQLHPKGEGVMPLSVSTSLQIESIAARYVAAAKIEREAKREKEKAGDEIRASLGDYAECRGSWGRVAWTNKKGSVSWKAAATAAGVTAEQLEATREPDTRSLSVRVNDDGGED